MYKESKNVLVTGGNGFIGSHVVDRLVYEGHKVTVIDNKSGDASDKHYYNEEAEYYNDDISSYKAIRPLFNEIDIVFHLAAEARIQPTLKDPILAAKTNMLGTCTVLQCAREANVQRVIYSSTSSAYGLKNEPPLSEDMLNDCLNPYSVTKTGGEELCKMYTKLFGLETVIFRYFNVYGERQPLKGQYAPVIGIFIRQKAAGMSMTIVGDGEQRRDFTHVDDIVEANIKAAELSNKDVVGETINVGTGINHSVNEIAEMIKGSTVNIEARPGEAKETQACTKKIEKLLKFKPINKLEEYIKWKIRKTY
jgi:UDP-glucose 4-epimerase